MDKYGNTVGVGDILKFNEDGEILFAIVRDFSYVNRADVAIICGGGDAIGNRTIPLNKCIRVTTLED